MQEEEVRRRGERRQRERERVIFHEKYLQNNLVVVPLFVAT